MHCEKCGSADTEVTKCAKCGQKSLIRCNNCSYQVCADKYCEVISIKRKIKILTYFAMLLVLLMVVILPVVVMRVMDEEETPTPTPRPTQVASVAPTKPPPPPPSPTPPPPAPDPAEVLRANQAKVSKLAKQLAAERVGYKKKSSDPQSGGVDFVGLVQHTLAAGGVDVPRNPGAILKMGKRVTNRTQLQPGDVMVFSKKAAEKRPNFLGIYIGDGEFACSWPAGKKAGVLTVDLDHKFWSPRFLFGVRILGNQ